MLEFLLFLNNILVWFQLFSDERRLEMEKLLALAILIDAVVSVSWSFFSDEICNFIDTTCS